MWKKGLKKFLPSFLSDDTILVPVNQQICKFLKCQWEPISLFRGSYIKRHLNSNVFHSKQGSCFRCNLYERKYKTRIYFTSGNICFDSSKSPNFQKLWTLNRTSIQITNTNIMLPLTTENFISQKISRSFVTN